MKRLISVLVVIVFCMMLFSSAAYAETPQAHPSYYTLSSYYEVDSDTLSGSEAVMGYMNYSINKRTGKLENIGGYNDVYAGDTGTVYSIGKDHIYRTEITCTGEYTSSYVTYRADVKEITATP